MQSLQTQSLQSSLLVIKGPTPFKQNTPAPAISKKPPMDVQAASNPKQGTNKVNVTKPAGFGQKPAPPAPKPNVAQKVAAASKATIAQPTNSTAAFVAEMGGKQDNEKPKGFFANLFGGRQAAAKPTVQKTMSNAGKK